MSSIPVEFEVEDDPVQPPTRPAPRPVAGSLEARMAAAAETQDTQTVEVFPIPGWETISAVRLRAVGFETLDRIATRNMKIRNPSMQKLYTAADQILVATDGFYEIVDNRIPGPDEEPVEDMSWLKLARAAFRTLGPETTPRQALIRLVGDERLAFFWNDWLEWVKSERSSPDRDVMRDFLTTR